MAGGKAGRARTLDNEEFEVRFDRAQDVTDLLASVCEWVLTGQVDVKVANAAVYAASAALRSLDAGEFEERLRVLEQHAQERRAA